MDSFQIEILIKEFPFLKEWEERLEEIPFENVKISEGISNLTFVPFEDSYSWSGGTRRDGIEVCLVFKDEKEYKYLEVSPSLDCGHGNSNLDYSSQGGSVLEKIRENLGWIQDLVAVSSYSYRYSTWEGWDSEYSLEIEIFPGVQKGLPLIEEAIREEEERAKKELRDKLSRRNKQIRDLRKSRNA